NANEFHPPQSRFAFYACIADTTRDGTMTMFVTDIGGNQTDTVTRYCAEVLGLPQEEPIEISLEPNRPNPFHTLTTIRYSLSRNTEVELVVFDVLGREVKLLIRGMKAKGIHLSEFDASMLPKGTYIVRLAAVSRVLSREVIVR